MLITHILALNYIANGIYMIVSEVRYSYSVLLYNAETWTMTAKRLAGSYWFSRWLFCAETDILNDINRKFVEYGMEVLLVMMMTTAVWRCIMRISPRNQR